MSFELRELTKADQKTFIDAYRRTETKSTFCWDYNPEKDFIKFLAELNHLKSGIGIPANWVPATALFGFMGDEIVGRLSIRHRLNENLEQVGGHIGYFTFEWNI
jgi:predicted acetyltransferase